MAYFSNFLPKNAIPDPIVGSLHRLLGKTEYRGADDEKKFVFFHVPKAAGTSISHSLFDENVGHISAKMYRAMDPQRFTEYFKFGFVRDPLSRFMSAYKYLKAGGINEADRAFSNTHLKGLSIEQLLERLKREKHSLSLFKLLNWGHFKPQNAFLCDNRKIIVDYFGKVENINADYAVIVERFAASPLEHKNIGPPSEININQSIKDAVVEIYSDDYEIFGYQVP